MGCASSKVLGSDFAAEKGSTGIAKSISLPTHPQRLPDDFHIVALTSSTYGILKVDPPKPSEEDTEDGMGAHSVKEVLSKLNNLESKEDAGPQSWLEVSSMLENLKPDLDKPTNTKLGKAINKPQQLDAIDINDIMLDLDEDTGLVRPKARKIANLKKSGKSLPIRTLEELDKGLGGKEHNAKKGASPAVSISDLRAALKPVGAAKTSSTIISEDKTSTTSSNKATNDLLRQNDEQNLSSVMKTRDGVIKKDSELIDGDFLESYKSAFNTLSEDDWMVVEALCQEAESSSQHDLEDERHLIAMHAGMVEESEAKSSSVSEDSFHVEELNEHTISSHTEGSSLMRDVVSGVESVESPKAVIVKKSPLEEYEELCPPGGKQAVVLYTTSMRGIRRTYEDCMKAREIVQSYGVMIEERDVSMHLEYRNELRELMQRVVTVPRLFIKGRYIGGAEVISKLTGDEGKLAWLLEGATRAAVHTEGGS